MRTLLFFLKPVSTTEIGIFAAQDVPAGSRLPLFAPKDYRLMRKKTMEKLPMSEILKTYCVQDSSGFHAPANWNQMSIGWYIRNSGTPTAMHHDYKFFASRDIKAGEEITVDFRTLLDERYQ